MGDFPLEVFNGTGSRPCRGLGTRQRRACSPQRARWPAPNSQLSIYVSLSTRNYGTFPAPDLDDRSFRRLARVTWLSRTLPIVFASTLFYDTLSQTPTRILNRYRRWTLADRARVLLRDGRRSQNPETQLAHLRFFWNLRAGNLRGFGCGQRDLDTARERERERERE